MNYSDEVQAAVDKLSPQARQYFSILINGAEENPFKSIKDINAGISNGDIEREHHTAAVLARTAIQAVIDGRPETVDLNDRTDALKLIREKIADAEADGDEALAERFRAGLAKLADKEEKADAKAEAFSGEAEKLRHKWDEERQAAYEKSFAEHKAQRIGELTKWGHLDAAQAEEKFQEVESAQVSTSLKRFHGIG
jgi:phage-related minor tail protein